MYQQCTHIGPVAYGPTRSLHGTTASSRRTNGGATAHTTYVVPRSPASPETRLRLAGKSSSRNHGYI